MYRTWNASIQLDEKYDTPVHTSIEQMYVGKPHSTYDLVRKCARDIKLIFNSKQPKW